MSSGTYAIALHARDEGHLRLIGFQLEMAGIPHTKIIENDAPYTDQLMAIGVVPCDRETVKKILRGLPLLK